MATSFQPIAASTPLITTLSAQIIQHTIKYACILRERWIKKLLNLGSTVFTTT